MKTIVALSKPTRVISQKTMHGNIYTSNKGHERVLYEVTPESNDDLIARAFIECEKLGLELWRIQAQGSKSTSFSTQATWCDELIYKDDTRASYFEGVFDGDGNRVDE